MMTRNQFHFLTAASLLGGLAAPAFSMGGDGVCTPLEQGQGLCFVSQDGFVVEAVTGPAGEFPVLDTFGNSVFSYRLTGPGNSGSCMNISHAAILLPECSDPLGVVRANPNGEIPSNGDPSCGFGENDPSTFVVKWNTGIPCNDTATFTVVIAGNVEAELTSFLIKSDDCETGMILGPSCETAPALDPYCEGDQSDCPCGNVNLSGTGGCANSTGGGAVLTSSGSTSIAADDLVLELSGVPPGAMTLFIASQGIRRVPLLSGLLCVGGNGNKFYRYLPFGNADGQGIAMRGPGLIAYSCSGALAPGSCIMAGQTWYFQAYYRDPNDPCGTGANLSNGLCGTFF